MERYIAIQPPEDTIIVTIVPEIDRVEFDDPHGKTQYAPADASARRLETLTETLGKINDVIPGPGNYTVDHLADLSGCHPMSLRRILPSIVSYAPGELLAYYPDPLHSTATVRIGRMVLAGRKATDEEREAHQQTQDSTIQAKLSRQKAEVHEAEAHKIDLTSYDHSYIVAGENAFYVPLDTPDGIAMARVIDIAAFTPPDMQLDSRLMIDAIWESLSINERKLFTASEPRLYGRPPQSFRKQVLHIVGKTTLNIGITQRLPWGARNDTPVRIAHMPEPPSADTVQHAKPLFPPGTPKQDVLSPEQDTAAVSDEDIRHAQRLLSLVNRGDDALSQSEALEIVELAMQRGCKRALAAKLGNTITFSETLDRAHAVARHHLRGAYWHVRSSWTIGQHSRRTKLNRIRLISGDLPIDTKMDRYDQADTPVTFGWTVGYRRG
jgi:hypothetical protein